MNGALAAVYAVLGGVVSGVVVSWFQHKLIWQRQKQLELKWSVFQEAVRALSLWSRDALDLGLQADKAIYKGSQRHTEMRPETMELLEKSKGMVQAFFSEEVSQAYDAVLRSHVSIETIPNEDFEQKRTAAIIKMARELGLHS